MANTQAELGRNRTGIATSPKLTREMVAGVQEFPPTPGAENDVIAQVRGDYARDADPLGSVPPPATLSGAAKTALRGAKGARPTQFIDKLLTTVASGAVEQAIVMVNNRTETRVGQSLLSAASAVCFPEGRITFWHPDGESYTPLQGQAIFYFGPDAAKFRERFSAFGVCLAEAAK